MPLARFPSDYQRMTKTQFPWKDYGFHSARDMLLSMETIVEFKFSDEENQFYLLPVHVTNGSNDNSSTRITESKQLRGVVIPGRSSGGIQRSSNGGHQSTIVTVDTMATNDDILAGKADHEDDGGFTVDQFGRVSVYVTQSKEKPAKDFWNVRIVSRIVNPTS